MAEDAAIDVARFVDEQKFGAFHVKLLILSFFLILFDGYDIGAAAFAAPSWIKAWGLASRAALAPVLAASLIGILFGAPILGFVGDMFGRKKAIIISCLVFGGFTLIGAWAGSLDAMWYLRFLAGIGIGGLLPNIIALTAEFAPRRMRATMIILMFTGITFGGSVPGAVSAWLVPHYGWPILFVIGGVAPIAMALVAAAALPESIKYLTVKRHDAEVARIVAAMQPGVAAPPPYPPPRGTPRRERRGDPVAGEAKGGGFVLADERHATSFSPRLLFSDGLAAITPLLWLLFVLNLMGFYFLASWNPTLLATANVSEGMAAIGTALFQIGGTIGGLTLSRPIDRKGFLPVTVLFAIAVPVIASVGYVGHISPLLLMLVLLLGGFCVLGLQFGLNAASAMIYPTAVRSNGSGWAFGIGRFGSVAGPYVGGYLIARHVPIEQLYVLATIPFALGAVVCFVLTRLYHARFKGYGLGQRELLDQPAAAE
jgi:MFS transporter, AAHS family, 4-hydroxybenzoate transporter